MHLSSGNVSKYKTATRCISISYQYNVSYWHDACHDTKHSRHYYSSTTLPLSQLPHNLLFAVVQVTLLSSACAWILLVHVPNWYGGTILKDCTVASQSSHCPQCSSAYFREAQSQWGFNISHCTLKWCGTANMVATSLPVCKQQAPRFNTDFYTCTVFQAFSDTGWYHIVLLLCHIWLPVASSAHLLVTFPFKLITAHFGATLSGSGFTNYVVCIRRGFF
jgi:hypothetical protein